MIELSESENLLQLDVEDTQRAALEDFFRQQVVKTMCPVKSTDTSFPGVFEIKLVNQYTSKQIQEMKTIFWTGYNSARIELGE